MRSITLSSAPFLALAVFAAVVLTQSGCDTDDVGETAEAADSQHTAEAADSQDAAEAADSQHIAELSQVVTLTLETRAGTGEFGWSLTEQALVPAAAADLTIFSTDCGARGRWVMLDGHGVQLCETATGDETADCWWSGSVEIGGSDQGPETGNSYLVQRDGVVVARLSLLDRTVLSQDWYVAPVAPFEVVLDVETVVAE